MEKKIGPFEFEISFYQLIAELILFFEQLMENYGWVMSPSRFYDAIAQTIGWFRDRELWHFGQPAFLYVMEQCDARSKKLAGTFEDEKNSMEMTMWRDREVPIPGGIKSILQIFDWFLPILRRTERKVMSYYDNQDTLDNGKEFTTFESWDTVFNVIDWLSKNQRFGKYNKWGQTEAYGWMQFVRDEMYGWRGRLLPGAPPIPNDKDFPFSVG